MTLLTKKVYLPDLVGKGYGEFWRFTGRYRIVKGSRGSKKSKTTALWYIVNLIKYPTDNLLVIRKTARTLKDSCFADLKWAMNRLQVAEYWDCRENPLEMTYRPTGQKILFRGLDDPLKITSISVEKGSLNFAWFEEAYEITRESDFDTIDESIRGEVDEGVFKQLTLTLNPWNERHWIKKRFFDAPPNPDVLTLTTTYACNEWLDKSDIAIFDAMKTNNPRRYRVAGLGEWGITDGTVYERFEELDFDLDEVRKIKGVKSAFGLDFGYTNDPTALFCGMIDLAGKQLFVFDEIYQTGMTNEAIADAVIAAGYRKENITADSAEPKSIDRLKTLGLRVKPAVKGKDSINAGIDFIQGFKIFVHPNCVNFLTEINNYTWDRDRNGQTLNRPIDYFNHLMDAMRYALEEYAKPKFNLTPLIT
jgi:phage terminase large subunit